MSFSILRLRLSGYCGHLADVTCAADQSIVDQEKTLQDAACSLQAVPILWYRKVREKKKNKNNKSPKTTRRKDIAKPASPTSAIQDDDDSSLFKLQHRSGPGIFSSSIFNDDKDEKGETEEDTSEEEQYYAGIEAVMSVCDTESGPALEIKSHGLQFALFQDKYEILDHDPDLDVVSSFLLEGTAVKGQDFLERTIPLNMIDHASPGQYWDWKNMINLTSGNCSCAVKVYGIAPDDKLMSLGKKLLLFDVLHSSVFNNEMMNRDKIIESLNVLLIWNNEQRALEAQVFGEGGDSVKGEDPEKNTNRQKIKGLMKTSFCC